MKRDFVIIRFLGNGKKYAVRFAAARIVEEEELVISRTGNHYFLILPGFEIGMPHKVLKKFVELANYVLEQERERWI